MGGWEQSNRASLVHGLHDGVPVPSEGGGGEEEVQDGLVIFCRLSKTQRKQVSAQYVNPICPYLIQKMKSVYV